MTRIIRCYINFSVIGIGFALPRTGKLQQVHSELYEIALEHKAPILVSTLCLY